MKTYKTTTSLPPEKLESELNRFKAEGFELFNVIPQADGTLIVVGKRDMKEHRDWVEKVMSELLEKKL